MLNVEPDEIPFLTVVGRQGADKHRMFGDNARSAFEPSLPVVIPVGMRADGQQ